MKTRGFRFERHVRNPLGARVLAGIYLGRAKKRGRKESGSPGFEAEKNPKEKETCVCVRERESIRARGLENLCKRERERASSKDEASVRTRGEWSVRTRSSRAS